MATDMAEGKTREIELQHALRVRQAVQRVLLRAVAALTTAAEIEDERAARRYLQRHHGVSLEPQAIHAIEQIMKAR